MATLESDKVDKALRGKMKSNPVAAGDLYYPILNDAGIMVASTSISHGAKQTLGHKRVAQMATQLCLGKSALLVDLVQCRLSREEAIKIMESNCPPGTSKAERQQVSKGPTIPRQTTEKGRAPRG